MIESKIIWEKLQQNKNFSQTIGLKNNSSLMVALNKDDEEKLRFKKSFLKLWVIIHYFYQKVRLLERAVAKF